MISEFFTVEGISVPAVSAAQMKEIDRIAVEETGPNLFQMMENAGRNLAELVSRILQNEQKKKILVLVGSGGNGGGGITSARHLSNWGFDVTVCVSDIERLRSVAKYQLHILNSTNAKVISINQLNKEKPDLIIDALIGYSLTGQPSGTVLEMIKWSNNQLAIVVSLDVPSGINVTSGEKSKIFINPDLTLTLALPKTGLLPELTGELFLCDIGIPPKVFQRIGITPPKLFTKDFIIKLSTKE